MLKDWKRAFLSWSFAIVVVAALGAVTLAYQFDTEHPVDVGGYYDRVYVQGFHDREPKLERDELRFRWGTAEATVLFPGVGARGRWLLVRMHGCRPACLPAPEVDILVNDRHLARITVGPPREQTGLWQEYRLWIPAQAAGQGTMRVTLETEPFVPADAGVGTDRRPLGVAVDRMELIPAGRNSLSPGWPAWEQLGWVLLFAAALYLGLAGVGLPRWWAALVTVLSVGGLAYLLAAQRLWVTVYTSRLAIVALMGLLLLPAFKWLFGRIFAWGRVSFGEREMRVLLAIFLVGFLIKAGGLLYPYSVAWDLKLQLQWSSWIWDGRLAELYGTESPLQERTMPQEWGEEKPLIPYSPFYHITAAGFFLLPWRPYDTANVLSVLLDTTRPFLIYFLARRLGLRGRTGLWAALLYAVFPATFLLHAWGNTPTTTGLWWTFAATCYFVGAWERLRHPRTWAGLVFFLLGAMLYYTPAAAFVTVFWGILLLGLWLNGRTLQPRPLGAVLLALLAAFALATAIYYGQFVGPILTVTIPRVLASVRSEGPSLGVVPVPWAEYVRATWVRMGSMGDGRGLLWPSLLALGGLIAGWRHLRRPLLRWVLSAWLGTALLFFLLGFRVDLVDKELWFVMPALALCGAMLLEWLWRRWRAGRAFSVILTLFLAASSLYIWILRLATIRQDWDASDALILGERLIHLGLMAWRVLFSAA